MSNIITGHINAIGRPVPLDRLHLLARVVAQCGNRGEIVTKINRVRVERDLEIERGRRRVIEIQRRDSDRHHRFVFSLGEIVSSRGRVGGSS